MASPSNSQQSSTGPVCLSLLKFSYATVPMDSVAPVPWTHISSKRDLFAMFETARTRNLDGSVEERKKFKVLRDPEVMEELDLEVLAREASEAIALSKNAHQHNRDQNVAIIVKVPVIAMKYPMTGGQVRRFQIRFASDESYYDAMKMLSRAHVPTIEAGTFPQRLQAAASNRTSGKSAQHIDNRPVSAAPRLDASQNPVTPRVSPERSANLDKRLATAISSMMPPPSHFTNPAQRREEDLESQQKDSQPRTSINLYTPRPSIVPAATSQHFSQLLPPRRELPFEKTTTSPQGSMSRVLRSATKRSEEPEPSPTKAQSTKPKKAPARKRASTASQTAASKKKRITAKAGGKINENSGAAAEKHQDIQAQGVDVNRRDTPVPKIDDVEPDQDQAISKRAMMLGAIDTQALLARAEEVRLSGLRLLPTDEVSPFNSQVSEHCTPNTNASFAGVQIPSIARVEVPTSSPLKPVLSAPTKPQTTTSTYPSTPANQLINPSTPSAPLAQHTIDTAPDPLSDSHPQAYNNPNTLSSLISATTLLMSHPAFANSDSNIAAWAALPSHQQSEALTTWVSNQYLDKTQRGGFEMLVKVMDACWEAGVVWPDVYRRSI